MGEARAVNFFGHAWLAVERRPDAGFVLGAMLPDLAAMAGVRIERVADGAAAAGLRFHHEADAAFHRAAGFRALSTAATRALSGAGVSRGPARAIAHVGIELLLDGWLAKERGVPEAYLAALGTAPVLAPAIVLRPARSPARLLAVCERVAAAPVADAAWCEPEPLALRLARILAPHPRLALAARELPAVAAWAAGARSAVAAAGPRLWSEVSGELSLRAEVSGDVSPR